jgi:tyrosinase
MAILTALAPDRRAFVAKKKVGGQITVRKDVRELSAQEVADYRTAVAGMAAISAQSKADTRGYQYIAGIHGIPLNYCHRSEPAFALWHRPYVQLFEQAMQDIVPSSFLPYWNWSEQFEIPQIFLDKTWKNPKTGKTEPNPLLAQPMNGGHLTKRNPKTAAALKKIAAQLPKARIQTTYDAFNPDLEQPHNDVHVWVRGDMQSISTAAYDPLFWAHHCFVEYVFCDWQDAHRAAAEPTDVSAHDLIPFGVTVDQIWIYKKLGYVYKPYNPKPLVLAGPLRAVPTATDSEDAAMLERPTLKSGATVATFALDKVEPDFNRAEVRFEGLTPPEDSFEVRIFVNEKNPNARTKTDGNPHYLGTRTFFGHGECFGAEGHCEPVQRDIFDLRPKHHYDPTTIRLNVTKPLRALIASDRASAAPVALVAVDPDGKEIPEPGLHFEGLSIVLS